MSVVIEPQVIDVDARRAAARWLRELGVILPTWTELSDPPAYLVEKAAGLSDIEPDEPDPLNLWRTHWFNGSDRRQLVATPGYVLLPPALTGVAAPIVVLLGRRFPMIAAHKVLAAYACLVARLVTGRFNPAEHRAIWPSTGNYCRGGVAISKILGCRGVAVLPAGMSRERFEWLQAWVTNPEDIVRTPGSESNVKEIYDQCSLLAQEPTNVVLNQFSEFANYLIHYLCTGRAAERVFSHLRGGQTSRRLAAFVSATGSAGTIAAGDYLKRRHGSKIVAVEALECPTMLANGYGTHNIQGIGDKHIPLIHNVMNTDVVIGVSDRTTDAINLLFGSSIGRRYLLDRRGLDSLLVDTLDEIGISGVANIVASIKLAKQFGYGPHDVIITVATDSAAMYRTESATFRERMYPTGFDQVHAGEIFGRCLEATATDHVIELSYADRTRIFNLGYFTWVEQQGVAVDEFDRRRDQRFWEGLVDGLPVWDRLIEDVNDEVRPKSSVFAGGVPS